MARKLGRKIEVYIIDGFDPVEIRFISETSMFFAEFLGEGFQNGNLNILKTELTAEASVRAKTVWKPVLKLSFSSWNNERSPAGFDIEKKMLGTTVYLNGTIKKVLADVTYKHDISVHDDWDDPALWRPSSNQKEWNDTDKEVKLIDCTKERYQTLKLIENRMTELKKQLVSVIKGDTGIEFLEALHANQQLFMRDDFIKSKLLTGVEIK